VGKQGSLTIKNNKVWKDSKDYSSEKKEFIPIKNGISL